MGSVSYRWCVRCACPFTKPRNTELCKRCSSRPAVDVRREAENAKQFNEWRRQLGALGVSNAKSSVETFAKPKAPAVENAIKNTVLPKEGKPLVVDKKKDSEPSSGEHSFDEARAIKYQDEVLVVRRGSRVPIIDQPQRVKMPNPRKKLREDAVSMPLDKPIPMLLWCPMCHERHIDENEYATMVHHTHACQHCGMVWRPSVQATVGVRFLPGFKNEKVVANE